MCILFCKVYIVDSREILYFQHKTKGSQNTLSTKINLMLFRLVKIEQAFLYLILSDGTLCKEFSKRISVKYVIFSYVDTKFEYICVSGHLHIVAILQIFADMKQCTIFKFRLKRVSCSH